MAQGQGTGIIGEQVRDVENVSEPVTLLNTDEGGGDGKERENPATLESEEAMARQALRDVLTRWHHLLGPEGPPFPVIFDATREYYSAGGKRSPAEVARLLRTEESEVSTAIRALVRLGKIPSGRETANKYG